MRIVTESELRHTLANEPDVVARRRELSRLRDSQAAELAEYELVLQNRRRHYFSSGERREFRTVESLPQSSSKRRRVNYNEPRAIDLATVAVSYKLRDRSLYWYGLTIAEMGNAFRRGVITEREFRVFIHHVKLMA